MPPCARENPPSPAAKDGPTHCDLIVESPCRILVVMVPAWDLSERRMARLAPSLVVPDPGEGSEVRFGL